MSARSTQGCDTGARRVVVRAGGLRRVSRRRAVRVAGVRRAPTRPRAGCRSAATCVTTTRASALGATRGNREAMEVQSRPRLQRHGPPHSRRGNGISSMRSDRKVLYDRPDWEHPKSRPDGACERVSGLDGSASHAARTDSQGNKANCNGARRSVSLAGRRFPWSKPEVPPFARLGVRMRGRPDGTLGCLIARSLIARGCTWRWTWAGSRNPMCPTQKANPGRAFRLVPPHATHDT